MMRRTLARTIASSSPRQGSLRPFLLAVLTTITVPNVSFACGMYIPLPEAQLVAEVQEDGAEKSGAENLMAEEAQASKLAAAFAAIDEAGLDDLLSAAEEAAEDSGQEPAAGPLPDGGAADATADAAPTDLADPADGPQS